MKLFASVPNMHINVPEPYSAICQVDTDTGGLVFIPIIQGPRGTSGIAIYNKDLCVLLQDTPQTAPAFARFIISGDSIQLRMGWSLDLVSNPHSMVLDRWKLLIASTGNDSVVRFDPRTGEEEIVWKHGEGVEDTIHINSVTKSEDGLLYGSMFGEKAEGQWQGNGMVIGLKESDETVFACQANSPHSLVRHNGSFLFCESGTDHVVDTRHGERLKIPCDGGYLRGLLIHDGVMIVGSSKRRLKSRSTGEATTPEYEGWCGLLVYELAERLEDSKLLKKIDMDPVVEVYEILAKP